MIIGEPIIVKPLTMVILVNVSQLYPALILKNNIINELTMIGKPLDKTIFGKVFRGEFSFYVVNNYSYWTHIDGFLAFSHPIG
jgi:hypothetical protein